MKHTKKQVKFKSPKLAWSFNSRKLSLYGGIATFIWDPLIQSMLGLVQGLNKDVISTEFKRLGQSGARLLEDMFGYANSAIKQKAGQKHGHSMLSGR